MKKGFFKKSEVFFIVSGLFESPSFEKGLLELVKNEKPEILESIQKSGKIENEIDKTLSEIITNYKKTNFEKK